jgi:hypothetical protein
MRALVVCLKTQLLSLWLVISLIVFHDAIVMTVKPLCVLIVCANLNTSALFSTSN